MLVVNPALVDNAYAVGHFLGDAELMGGEENGHAFAGAFLQNILEDTRVVGI